MAGQKTRTVNIRPGVGILSVLRHLNYRPWFAMAEFVDNAIQSYLQHRDALRQLHQEAFRLKIEIEIDRSDELRIKIRDNAAGIATSEYGRAFRAAELPADRTGLAEFGMGMKSAACWFAPRWRVRTSALGESVQRVVTFDINSIVKDELEELDVVENDERAEAHYTEITLFDPHSKLQTKTLLKVKQHLASIYRIYLRERQLELWFDGEQLNYDQPAILVYPYFKRPTSPPQRWYKEFDFDFGFGLRAKGFAALRETASTSTAGFALFRRNRLIEGSWDEPYRPEHIFGSGNTYRKQRLFGEIHLEGFEVSHTKDGFKWEENEDTFLELLRAELETVSLPLLSQAEGFRARAAQRELRIEAEKANSRVVDTIEKEAPPILESQASAEPVTDPPPESLPSADTGSSRTIELAHRGTQWRVTIELSIDPGVEDWLTITDRSSAGARMREIGVRMSLAHPFMVQFCKVESSEIEALERVAVALALAEITARDAGVPQYGTIRRNVNQLLRDVLSKP